MSAWTLIQIVFNIFMACGLFVIVMRMNRAPKDDPRLSRGLQLLQSKISVLEDLSDRTEAQVNQLTAILESKSREVQAKVQLAEQHVHEIRLSMDRSLEVAKIFQDKIPHKEIIERQNTIKYVQAARLAHQGASVEEIATAVDLPRGEVEFIASVNRERLMFDENALPEWAKPGSTSESAENSAADQTPSATLAASPSSTDTSGFTEERTARLRAEIELSESQRLVENLSRLQSEMQSLDQQLARESSHRDYASAFEVPRVETDSLKKLGEQFRQAVKDGEVSDSRQAFFTPLEQISSQIGTLIPAVFEEEHSVGEVLRAPVAAPTPAPSIAASQADGPSKIQQALRSTAQAAAPRKTSTTPANLSELQAARAVAREAAAKPVAKGEPGSVRRVVFPRIDGTEV